MKKWLVGTCIGLLLCAGTVVSASALEIVLAISAAPGSTQYITAEEFTRRANELLGDKAQVVFYGSGQLRDDKDLMHNLNSGLCTNDFGVSCPCSSKHRKAVRMGHISQAGAQKAKFWSTIGKNRGSHIHDIGLAAINDRSTRFF